MMSIQTEKGSSMSDVERIHKRNRKNLTAQQQHALKVLLKEGGLNKILFEALPVFFVAIGPGGKTVMMNEALLQTLGYSEEDVVGKDYLTTFVPENERKGVAEVFDRLIESHSLTTNENSLLSKDGRKVLVEWHGRPILKENDNVDFFFGIGIDITERRAAEEALRVEKAYFEQLFESAPEAVALVDNNSNIFRINSEFTEMFGYTLDEVHGRSIDDLLAPDDLHGEAASLTKEVAAGKKVAHETLRKKKDGNLLDVSILGTPITVDGGQEAVYAIYRDITERKQAEDLMRKSERIYQELSITDNLTKLYNQRHFYNQLTIEIDRSKRYKNSLSLLMLDVDDFKQYNDNFGHLEGDDVLVRLARVIQRNIRGSDSAYRYGGEEFVVILPEAKGEEAAIVAERIRGDFKKETFFPDEGEKIKVSVSIGVSELLTDDDLTVLLERADKRMYKAKKQGKDRVVSLDSR
jgi:diguanylate cyclase (GGDEF)-like protein/PAS domain S-box-containing protein